MDAWALVAAISCAVCVLVAVIARSAYRKVGPDEVLVISGGRSGFRFVRGGGTFVRPVVEYAQTLSLKAVVVDPRVSVYLEGQEAPTSFSGSGIVKIDSAQSESLTAAVERFLGRPPDDLGKVARETIERCLREAVAEVGAAEAIGNPSKLAAQTQALAEPAMRQLGLTLVTFTAGPDQVD
jgi:flotillin